MEITTASVNDLGGIRSLIDANHIDRVGESGRADGFVAGNMTDAQLETLIVKERGATVAREDGKVLAFAMAASWNVWKESPLLAYLAEKLGEFPFDGRILTSENSYQYGPVCLDASVRGTGLFERLFFACLAGMRDRYPITATFINRLNGRSYAAHTRKAGMTRIGTFRFENGDYYLMARLTAPSK